MTGWKGVLRNIGCLNIPGPSSRITEAVPESSCLLHRACSASRERGTPRNSNCFSGSSAPTWRISDSGSSPRSQPRPAACFVSGDRSTCMSTCSAAVQLQDIKTEGRCKQHAFCSPEPAEVCRSCLVVNLPALLQKSRHSYTTPQLQPYTVVNDWWLELRSIQTTP